MPFRNSFLVIFVRNDLNFYLEEFEDTKGLLTRPNIKIKIYVTTLLTLFIALAFIMDINFLKQISLIKPLPQTNIYDTEMELIIIYMRTSLKGFDILFKKLFLIFHLYLYITYTYLLPVILIYCTSLNYYYFLFAAALYHQLQFLKKTDGEAKIDVYVSSDDDGLFLDCWRMLFWPIF